MHEDSKTSHAFNRAAEKNFLDEREKIYIRYSRKTNMFFKFFSFVYKIIIGSYIISLVDTLKYKGKNISSVIYNLS